MKKKIDLHVHTNYSSDSLITPKKLVSYAKRSGLDGVAITDHDRIDGAQEMMKNKEIFVIPGIEVSSSNGHIIGLNVHELIPKGLDANETIDKIHDLGGLAVACHPVTLLQKKLGKIVARCDAIEVINASAIPFSYSVYHSRQLAFQLGLSQVAGSDAHYAPEIGYAFTLVETELTIDGVMKAIEKQRCEPKGSAIPLTIRLKRNLLRLKQDFLR
jgi:predicted metal-dependent phosphoesterase TrpH